MARSIHETRRDLARETDPRRRRAIEEQLDRKRRFKAASRGSRAPLPEVVSSAVEVRRVAWRRESRFAATEDDVLGVLSMLPAGLTDGVARIELHGSCREPMHHIASVYSPRNAFELRDGGSTIRMFSWTWETVLPVLQPYLAAEVLTELLRALAMSQIVRTKTRRAGISSVVPDDDAVRLRMYEWRTRAVIGWLRQSARAEIRALETWIAEHGGVGIPFARILESRCAFERLVDAIAAGASIVDARTAFAESLHWAGDDRTALSILRTIPRDVHARNVRTCIALCRGRFREAERVARTVLAIDPRNVRALHYLADALQRRGEWAAVMSASTELLAIDRIDRGAQLKRIRALIELRRIPEAFRALDRVGPVKPRLRAEFDGLRAYGLVRQRRYAEAAVVASAALAVNTVPSIVDRVARVALAHANAAVGIPNLALPPFTRRALESACFTWWLSTLDRDFPGLIPREPR